MISQATVSTCSVAICSALSDRLDCHTILLSLVRIILLLFLFIATLVSRFLLMFCNFKLGCHFSLDFFDCSCENHWDINFSGISIAEAYDHSKEVVDISKLLSQIRKINPQKSDSIVSHVKSVTTCYRAACSLETYLSITQGHDFLYLFQAFYDALKGKKGQTINVAGIFKSLLCSYGEICFSETKLYQKLTAYQDMHRVIIVKSPNYYNS